MTLHQTLRAAPARTNELLARLADTSNAAVKTRDKLLAELGTELQLYIDLESQHLLPELRKHDATKTFVAEAIKGAKALRGALTELEAAPRDGDAFLEKLGALRTGFEQHLRDEKQELLPVIAKLLEAEAASDVAANIERGIAAADAAKRAEDKATRDAAKQAREAAEAQAETERAAAKARRDAAKRAREASEARAAAKAEAERAAAKQRRDAAKLARATAEAQAEAGRAAVRARKAAAKRARVTADDAAQRVEIEATAGRQVVRQVAGQSSAGLAPAATSTRAVLGSYRESAPAVTADRRAVGAASSASARGLADAGSAWGAWLSEAARINAEATRRLLGCRTLAQVAEAQRDYGRNVMRNWMAASTRVLSVSQATARQAAKPLDGRLNPGG